MHIRELNEIAATTYKKVFGENFYGWVEWSNRMKVIIGNCRSNGRIALNRKYYEKYGRKEILSVLYHELAHLYCFKKIGKHNHNNPLFLKSLNKIGGTMFGKRMPTKVHIYQCPSCKKQWLFKKKLITDLACSTCSKGTYDKKFQINFIGFKIIE